MKLTKILLLFGFLASLAACSTQNRQAAEMATQEEIFGENGLFDQTILGLNTFGVSSSDLSGNQTYVYHARETQGRPAVSILNVGDMSVFSNSFLADEGSWDIDMQNVDVVFIDHVENGERTFAFGLFINDEFVTNGSSQNFTFSSKAFEVEMPLSSGSTIVIRSTDISPDYDNELASAVKLQIYTRDNGGLRLIGQVSTMHGYGN